MIKRDSDLTGIFDNVKLLLGTVALFLGEPVNTSGAIMSAKGVVNIIKKLAEKNVYFDLCNAILKGILSRKPIDYSGRIEKMQEAFGIIYYTSFLDELDDKLPSRFRSELVVTLDRKTSEIIKAAHQNCAISSENSCIVMPDFVCGIEASEKHLEKLYHAMTNWFIDYVQGLSFADMASERERSIFLDLCANLPKNAVKRFREQYLYLCSNYNEFYVFMQTEQARFQRASWQKQYQDVLSIATRIERSSEIGFSNLTSLIINQRSQIKKESVSRIVESLIEKYTSDVEESIIGNKEKAGSRDALIYPSIGNAFIPQAYKLISYSGHERLEFNSTWSQVYLNQDMMVFWAKYFLSPESIDSLLLILGDPGSGKSVLTRIICGRMISTTNIVIRIPLREHNVEDSIESIVCKQIQRDGDASEKIETFKWFAEEFSSNPTTLLFDGYDEILQSTGGIYRNLLQKISEFQKECKKRHRPVRIAITSRQTLIEIAEIPEGTIVMKLMEFDDYRKNQWISVWNKYNKSVFDKFGLKSFALPVEDSNIALLSNQPLLLLMIAIYDADFENMKNAIDNVKVGKNRTLNRVGLYNELLRRFIRRELLKGPRGYEVSFEELNDENSQVNSEMKKLGIVALGMFIREKLSLTVGELDSDLNKLSINAISYEKNQPRQMLKNAEVLFGSFFFIHCSGEMNGLTERSDIAFEFLHKTFYEFLLCDLFLNTISDVLNDLRVRRNIPKLGERYYNEALSNLKGDPFDPFYYSVLSSRSICSEPEVVQLLDEWKEEQLHENSSDDQNHGNQVDTFEISMIISDIFQRHYGLIRSGVNLGYIFDIDAFSFERSAATANAIYMMNLLTLAVLLTNRFSIQYDTWLWLSRFLMLNAIPGDRKSDGVNSNYDLSLYEDAALQFISLFKITKHDNLIYFEKKACFEDYGQKDILKAKTGIFSFLCDDASKKIFMLHDNNLDFTIKQELRGDLYDCGLPIDFEWCVGKLHQRLLGITRFEVSDFREEILWGLHYLTEYKQDASLVLDWLLCIQLMKSMIPELTLTNDLYNLCVRLNHLINKRYIDDNRLPSISQEILTHEF